MRPFRVGGSLAAMAVAVTTLAAMAIAGMLAGAPVAAQSPQLIEARAKAALALPGQGETRVLIVAQKGKVVFKHVAPGFTDAHRFVSWSMAKTVTAMALGILVDEGRIDIDQPAPVKAWRAASDGRETITTRHLLTMTSGLAHQEMSGPGRPIERSDTVRMLFTDRAQSAAAHAIGQPLAHRPGTHWQYSTATSHILADIISHLITTETEPAKRRAAVARWFQDRLFGPLGITSAEWDFDAAGLFLGGSMLHMTALDYLKLGQFMLDRGVTREGKRLLSERFVDVMTTKAAAANNNHYAGHLWLNTGPAEGQPPVLFHPKGGAATMAMIGHLGQYVVIVPEADAVVVRIGKSVSAERPVVRAALGDIVEMLIGR